MNETGNKWMDASEAASYLGIDDETIRRRARDGSLRYTRVNNSPTGALRFKREWLDEYMERRAQGGEDTAQ